MLNEQLRLENETLKVLELAYQNNKVDKTAVLESFGFKILLINFSFCENTRIFRWSI